MKRMTLDELLAAANKPSARRTNGPLRPPSDEEHRLQVACVRWFNLKYPHLKGRLFAVPNGGRRDAVTGARLKAEGVVAGVADLVLLKRNRCFGALLIEMKTMKGRQNDSQRWWQSAITKNDEYKYVVCRSYDGFIREVERYLNDTERYGQDGKQLFQP